MRYIYLIPREKEKGALQTPKKVLMMHKPLQASHSLVLFVFYHRRHHHHYYLGTDAHQRP